MAVVPTPEYGPLNPHFVNVVVAALPPLARHLLEEFPLNVFVAGGFIRDTLRGTEPKDCDLFLISPAGYDDVLVAANDSPLASKEVKSSGWATTFFDVATETPVQIIRPTEYTSTAEQLLTFDFTTSQAAIWFGLHDTGWHSLATQEFVDDIALGVMHYVRPVRRETALGSFNRMLQFLRRGWSIPQEDALKIVARVIGHLNLTVENDWPDGKGSLQYTESDAFSDLMALTKSRGYIAPADGSLEAAREPVAGRARCVERQRAA